MRTTVRLDDGLLRRAKAAAAMSGRSLNDLVVDAVRTALADRPRGVTRPVHLPAFTGNGLQPGVDLDDNPALLDLMNSVDE